MPPDARVGRLVRPAPTGPAAAPGRGRRVAQGTVAGSAATPPRAARCRRAPAPA
jgi:hypothetical protein